jgi:hypothetical protein
MRGMGTMRKKGCVIARKFDSKGRDGSEFSEPPASFVAARTFILNDANALEWPLAGLIYSSCVPLQQLAKLYYKSNDCWLCETVNSIESLLHKAASV